MGMGLGFFGSIIVGIIAGWLAEKIMKRDHGLLTNLIVGVLGGLLGAGIMSFFGSSSRMADHDDRRRHLGCLFASVDCWSRYQEVGEVDPNLIRKHTGLSILCR